MSKAKTSGPAVGELRSHVGFWLRFVSNHVSQAFASKLLASGVTPAEWVVLREMYDRHRMSPGMLADLTGMTRGGASKLMDRLVARNLVTRQERAADRRYQDIELTSAGRRLVPVLAAIADRSDEEFFKPLSARERAALVSTLKKLAQAHRLQKIPTE